MYRSTLAVYSVNLRYLHGRGCHSLHGRRRGLRCRRCISKSLCPVKEVRHCLVGQVIYQGKNYSVSGGHHLLRATNRQAYQNTRGQHIEEKSNK